VIRKNTKLRSAAALTLFALVACASGPSLGSFSDGRTGFNDTKASTGVHKTSSSAPTSTLLYVANQQTKTNASGTVTVYDVKDNYKLDYTITSGIKTPENLAVSKGDVLFVQNNSALTVYDQGATSPSYRISNPKGVGATGVVVGSEGSAYVTYATDLSGSGCGFVRVFPKGSNTPSLTITNGVCNPECSAPRA